MASSAADSTLLAIVVLAYRPDFLDQTLASLAAQAPGAYRIYLFDDAGPEAVHEAVQRWSDRMALRYHRFPENLGQYDLAGHWARCIRATQGEPWVWLFSDDDVMRPGSVEALLRKAGEGGLDEGCVYRIPMEMIDAEGHTVTGSGAWPPHLDAAGYLRQRLGFRLLSSVNEFIFSRASFDAYGFPSFPQAWCADDAAWIRFGLRGGLVTLQGGGVGWRNSGFNISADIRPKNGKLRIEACLQYLNWLKEMAREAPQLRMPLALRMAWLGEHWLMLRPKGHRFPPAYAWAPIRNSLSIPGLVLLLRWLALRLLRESLISLMR